MCPIFGTRENIPTQFPVGDCKSSNLSWISSNQERKYDVSSSSFDWISFFLSEKMGLNLPVCLIDMSLVHQMLLLRGAILQRQHLVCQAHVDKAYRQIQTHLLWQNWLLHLIQCQEWVPSEDRFLLCTSQVLWEHSICVLLRRQSSHWDSLYRVDDGGVPDLHQRQYRSYCREYFKDFSMDRLLPSHWSRELAQ